MGTGGVEPPVSSLSEKCFAVKLHAHIKFNKNYSIINFKNVKILHMIFFTEIKNKRVKTEDNNYVGKLEDLIFHLSDDPLITKILVINNKRDKLIIPFKYLQKINKEVTIAKNFQVAGLEQNEFFLMRNLLDKQIIDLKGNKLVRVNDIIIQERNNWYVEGVDIGILGILRYLGIERFVRRLLNIIGVKIQTKTLAWSDIQPLDLTYGKVKLKSQEEKLKKMKPEDLADYIENTNITNAEKILSLLNQKQVIDVFNNLRLSYQAELFKRLSKNKAVKIISLIDPDEAVDILLTLSPKKREEIIESLDINKKNEIKKLISLAKTDIGHLITPEFLAVDSNLTVGEVKAIVKKETGDFYSLPYIYVLNSYQQLIGVFALHELLLNEDDSQVFKFMTQNIIVAHLSTPKEIVFKKMIKYKLQAIPVIDENKKMLGIITLDDLIEDLNTLAKCL